MSRSEGVRPGSASGFLLGLGLLAFALGAGFLGASGREAGTNPPTGKANSRDRAGGCPICLKMVESLPEGEFSRDVHAFECSVCHHPHTRQDPEAWRMTCSQEGCHPRAWTRTVFHRVDARVFVDCTNCHGVHRWALEGQDCAGCHAGLVDSAGVIPVSAVAGVDRFDHGPHREVECARCHDSGRRHGSLAFDTASECSACHHSGRDESSCRSCHGGREIAFSRAVDLRMALDVWDDPRVRPATFPHAVHAKAARCSDCHAGGGMAGKAECSACHDAHHEREADCTQCHGTPPAGAHDISVHQEECTTCHERGPAPKAEPPRSFCLTCHRSMGEHNPGERCTDCHDPAGITGD